MDYNEGRIKWFVLKLNSNFDYDISLKNMLSKLIISENRFMWNNRRSVLLFWVCLKC